MTRHSLSNSPKIKAGLRRTAALLAAFALTLSAGCSPRETAVQPDAAPDAGVQAALGHSQSQSASLEEDRSLSDTLVISTATNQFAAAKRIVIRPSSGQSSGASQAGTVKVKPASGTASAAKKNLPDELRGIWISYLDFNTLLKNKSASAFKTNIGGAFDNIAALGLDRKSTRLNSSHR